MSWIKGEWDWSAKEDMTHGVAITSDGAVFATVEGTDEEARDTACIMATAKDLLKGLEKAYWLLGVMVKEGYLNADYSIKELIETAIAKAQSRQSVTP